MGGIQRRGYVGARAESFEHLVQATYVCPYMCVLICGLICVLICALICVLIPTHDRKRLTPRPGKLCVSLYVALYVCLHVFVQCSYAHT